MTLRIRTAAIVTAAALAIASTPAFAGSPVYGYGPTRSDAVADANRNAARMSQNRFGRSDCRTPVRPQDCRQDGGGWVCIAYLANHRGSCGF